MEMVHSLHLELNRILQNIHAHQISIRKCIHADRTRGSYNLHKMRVQTLPEL